MILIYKPLEDECIGVQIPRHPITTGLMILISTTLKKKHNISGVCVKYTDKTTSWTPFKISRTSYQSC